MPLNKPALAALALILLAGGCANVAARLVTPEPETRVEALRAGEYRLDPAHATLLFKIDHLGLSQYVGRFNDFDARLDFDPDAPEAARVDADIEIVSLDVADPDFAATLLGPQWFDAETHPKAFFRTKSVEQINGDGGRVTGELTMMGNTAPVVLDVGFRGGARNPATGDYTLGFVAFGEFDRTAFGLDRFVGPVGRMVDIEIHAEFVKTD